MTGALAHISFSPLRLFSSLLSLLLFPPRAVSISFILFIFLAISLPSGNCFFFKAIVFAFFPFVWHFLCLGFASLVALSLPLSLLFRAWLHSQVSCNNLNHERGANTYESRQSRQNEKQERNRKSKSRKNGTASRRTKGERREIY